MRERERLYKKKVSPPLVLIVLFLTVAFVGGILLSLPIAHEQEPVAFIDALFTSVSALTVTGLVVVDTGTTFSVFGQVIIMLLIQVGGLGIMTFAIFFFFLIGKKVGIQQRLVVQQALNQRTVGGILMLAKRVLLYSLTIEGVAFLLLAIRWVPEWGWKFGLFTSAFHTVSAFNNAGFSLWSDSLTRYASDPTVTIIITLLFMIGGLGFTVLVDLWKTKRFQDLMLHSKIMIVATISVTIVSTIVLFIIEMNNPHTIGSMSLENKWLASYFQAVTPRTAGFNTVDISQLEEPSLFFILGLMFVGAGSASTGGGIKLTTFVALTFSVITFIQDREEVHLYKRTIPVAIIMKAMAITLLSMAIIFVVVFILELTEEAPFLMILFEVVSAFGTVGLSMGLTTHLTVIGKLLIMFMMFVGKIGPLTLAYMFTTKRKSVVHYPREDVLTG